MIPCHAKCKIFQKKNEMNPSEFFFLETFKHLHEHETSARFLVPELFNWLLFARTELLCRFGLGVVLESHFWPPPSTFPATVTTGGEPTNIKQVKHCTQFLKSAFDDAAQQRSSPQHQCTASDLFCSTVPLTNCCGARPVECLSWCCVSYHINGCWCHVICDDCSSPKILSSFGKMDVNRSMKPWNEKGEPVHRIAYMHCRYHCWSCCHATWCVQAARLPRDNRAKRFTPFINALLLLCACTCDSHDTIIKKCQCHDCAQSQSTVYFMHN